MHRRSNLKIEVLGSRCGKCQKLLKNTKEAVERIGIDAEVLKIEDVTEIIKHNVAFVPALVIDGEVVIFGSVPGVPEIIEFINSASENNT